MTLLTPKQYVLRRQILGVGQAKLSRQAGLRSNYVNRFERGNILAPSGVKLAALELAFKHFEELHASRKDDLKKEMGAKP